MDEPISVIVPNREGEEVLGPCLHSLSRQTLKPGEVIVVDDASRDGSVSLVRRSYPWVRILCLPESRGYAGACVAGFKEASGSWIAVLNNDAVAEPGWLSELVAAAKSEERVGAAASRVILLHPPGIMDSAGLEVRRNGMAFLRLHGKKETEVQARELVEEVFGPAGSAALYRRTMLEEVGFFEPDFINFYEDVDLAFRARWRGWKCVLAHRARVIHRHSYTIKRLSLSKRYFLQHNRWRTIIRNWPLSSFLVNLPFIVGYDLASLVIAFREGQGQAALKARLDLLRFLPKDLEARKALLSQAVIPADEMKKWLIKKKT